MEWKMSHVLPYWIFITHKSNQLSTWTNDKDPYLIVSWALRLAQHCDGRRLAVAVLLESNTGRVQCWLPTTGRCVENNRLFDQKDRASKTRVVRKLLRTVTEDSLGQSTDCTLSYPSPRKTVRALERVRWTVGTPREEIVPGNIRTPKKEKVLLGEKNLENYGLP